MRELPANLSGRVGEIYFGEDRFKPGKWRVLQDTPESADCCLDFRCLERDLTYEEAEQRVEDYLAGRRPIPPWPWR
jgi:hypothetical protein